MSLAQMERFRFVPLAIRPEKGDVVYAGEAAKVAREHVYYGPGVCDEIADAIEALKS